MKRISLDRKKKVEGQLISDAIAGLVSHPMVHYNPDSLTYMVRKTQHVNILMNQKLIAPQATASAGFQLKIDGSLITHGSVMDESDGLKDVYRTEESLNA